MFDILKELTIFKVSESNKINIVLKEASQRQKLNVTVLFPRVSTSLLVPILENPVYVLVRIAYVN